jgi:hypothetical protein
MNKMTVAEIRTKYPEPIRVGDAAVQPQSVGDYCGGGACMLAEEGAESSTFPGPKHLADFLWTRREGLPYTDAAWYARTIIATNDTGAFEDAWTRAAEAFGDTDRAAGRCCCTAQRPDRA